MVANVDVGGCFAVVGVVMILILVDGMIYDRRWDFPFSDDGKRR